MRSRKPRSPLPYPLIVRTIVAVALVALAAASGTAQEKESAAPHPWLEEIGWLITDAEREAFAGLAHDYQRQAFIRRFWEVRDPFPRTGLNEFRDEWEARREEGERRYRSLESDRARAFLLLGEPDLSLTEPCREILGAIEVWSYTRRSSRPLEIVFRRAPGTDPYRIWSFRDPVRDLLDPFSGSPNRQVQAVSDAVRINCPRGDVLARALLNAPGPDELRHEVLGDISREWVSSFVARSTTVPEGAAELPGSFSVSFPGRHRSRTVVQGLIEIDRSEAKVSERGEHSGYNFLLDGEVLREGELFEAFRYRFDLPLTTVTGERVPLVLERYLRPGTYTLVVKLEDLNGERFFYSAEELEVPRVEPRASIQHVAMPELTPEERRALVFDLQEANASIDEGDHTLRLIPPTDQLHIGALRVQAEATGDDIAKVAFFLNGRRVMAKRRAPYSVELSLGDSPGIHNLEAVAYDAGENVLARDALPINAGPHRFDIRLIEPQRGRQFEHSLRAVAEVTVPPLDKLDRVEFYLNERLIATAFQPPFVQPLLLPEDEATTYVRAVAHLANGNTAEDFVFVNAPDNLDQVDIQFVELYTTFLDRRGRPLPQEEAAAIDQVTVREDGVEQEIRRFESVTNRPFHAALVLDASTSMESSMRQVERAALRFFENVLRPQDRAAVVVFNEHTDLRVPLTNSLEVLAGGLTELRADGDTALYDSLIYSLYYLAGLKGKRSIILISDGEDSDSKYSFQETLEFAKRVGVSIYAIGIDLAGRSPEGRNQLMRLANETGGSTYFVSRANDLEKTYDRIEDELRSQFLIGYQSSATEGESYRKVEVKVERPGVKAKTIPGYYP